MLNSKYAVILAAFLGGCVASQLAQVRVANAQEAMGAARVRWEYKAYSSGFSNQETGLNGYGANGWELVTCNPSTCILKRPL
jgi:hypothetical protein